MSYYSHIATRIGIMARAASIIPRKPPTQVRSAQTVEAILEAAARILETDGLAGYTTNRIAETAGVSVGSLYQYFPNKEAVTAALVLADSQRFLTRMQETAARVKNAPVNVAIAELVEVSVAHHTDRPELSRLLDQEEGRLALHEDLLGVRAGIFNVVHELMASRKLETPFEPEAATQDILALVQGITDKACLHGETDLEVIKVRVCYAVFGYLRLPAS